MAIYATPLPPPDHRRAATAGVDLQVVAGPPRDHDPGDVGFVFWAMQVSFVDDAGTSLGGGHFGLQWFCRGAATRFGVVNWGVYDDIVGGGATFRGSIPTDARFVDIGVPPSWGVDYEYGDWCRFRCTRSPRQDWTAGELDTGDGPPRRRRAGDQAPDEVAFRVTVDNLGAGTGPVAFRDVLVGGSPAADALAHPVLWTETDAGVLARGPVARFANLWWDGAGTVDRLRVGYAEGTDATDCGLDGDGAVVQAGARPRRTAAGTELTLSR